MIIIVMGVAGAGKTTIGRELATRLGGEYLEGDAYHPSSNIEKMRRGIALSDRDRAAWLTNVSQEIAQRKKANTSTPTVVSCSALKRRYRDQLRKADPDLLLVYLAGTHDLLMERLTRRQDHFMAPQLLTSQLSTLEPPQEDESPIVVDIASSVRDIVNYVCSELRDRQKP